MNTKTKPEVLSTEEHSRKAARDLANAVNRMDFDHRVFAEELCAQHRTLQQNSFRAIGHFLIELANEHKHGYFDLRNEHAAKTASEIVAQYHDQLRYVPFI